jgi:hypothetical protein
MQNESCGRSTSAISAGQALEGCAGEMGELDERAMPERAALDGSRGGAAAGEDEAGRERGSGVRAGAAAVGGAEAAVAVRAPEGTGGGDSVALSTGELDMAGGAAAIGSSATTWAV